jgi:hypothetical protein
MIFKVLPDAIIAWSDVWIGTALTSPLFTPGKLLIGLSPGHASAGSLLMALVWVYYAAQIFFSGAEFAQVCANRYGACIAPAAGAVALAGTERAPPPPAAGDPAGGAGARRRASPPRSRAGSASGTRPGGEPAYRGAGPSGNRRPGQSL